MDLKNKHLFKLICIFNFLVIILSLIIIKQTPPASSYEISMYSAYPWYFWLLIEIPIISLFFAFFFEAEYGGTQRLNYCLIISAILALSIFSLLPYFRGYALYGNGDTHTHIGYIKVILSTGFFGGNIYPAIHILISVISNASNIEPKTISFFIQLLYSLIYILGINLLSKHLNYNQQTRLLIIAFTFIPILGTEFTRESILPSFDAFSIIPLTLYFCLKAEMKPSSIGYAILLVAMLILFPFFHPEGTLFLLIILVTIQVITRLSLFEEIYKFTPIILLSVVFIAWFSSWIIFGKTVNDISASLVSNVVQGPLMSRTIFQPTTLIDKLDFIFRAYGAILIYVIIATIFSVSTIIKVIIKKEELNYDFLMSFLFIVLSLTSFIFLKKGILIGYNMYRMLKYPLLISTILIGSFFAKRVSLNESKHRNINKIIIYTFLLITIIGASSLSIYSAYPSTKTFGLNYQVTDKDLKGMQFLLTYRNDDRLIMETIQRSYQTRFSDLLLGVGIMNKKNIRSGYEPNILPPPHFGYDLQNNIGSAYTDKQYLILYPLSEKYYSEIYPNQENLWRYSLDDLQKLKIDETVNFIYSNGEFKLLEIEGIKRYHEV